MGLREERKKKKVKEVWPSPLKEGLSGSPGRIKGLDQDILELPEPGWGFSGSVGKNQLGFRQLKEACLWAQGTKVMSHQPPTTQKKSFGNRW